MVRTTTVFLFFFRLEYLRAFSLMGRKLSIDKVCSNKNENLFRLNKGLTSNKKFDSTKNMANSYKWFC